MQPKFQHPMSCSLKKRGTSATLVEVEDGVYNIWGNARIDGTEAWS